jgi:hypothetical protein
MLFCGQVIDCWAGCADLLVGLRGFGTWGLRAGRICRATEVIPVRWELNLRRLVGGVSPLDEVSEGKLS